MRKRWLPVIAIGTVVAVAITYWVSASVTLAASAEFSPRVGAGAASPAAPSAPPAAGTSKGTRGIAAIAPQPTKFAAASNSINDLRIGSLIPGRTDQKIFGSEYSIHVLDAKSGETVYAASTERARLPASTMKLLTAFTALSALAPSTRVTTTVVALGEGDIAIVGAGDATLTTENLATLAVSTREALQRQHLFTPPCSAATNPAKAPCRKRQVRVHYVDTLFGKRKPAPGWMKEYVPYNVSVTSLGLMGDYSSNPAQNVAKVFAQFLTNKTTRGVYDPKRVASAGTPIATLRGRTVDEQVNEMLQHSDNNIAEILFRRVALQRGQRPTWTGSQNAAVAILTQAGLPVEGLKLFDGSGLSRKNRVTTTLLNTILAKAVTRSENPELSTIYYGPGLPTGGVTGTLVNRFRSKTTRCARGNVRAKTGNLHDVVTLAGVATGSDGRVKVFSIMVNARPERYAQSAVRNVIDNIVTAVVGCA